MQHITLYLYNPTLYLYNPTLALSVVVRNSCDTDIALNSLLVPVKTLLFLQVPGFYRRQCRSILKEDSPARVLSKTY